MSIDTGGLYEMLRLDLRLCFYTQSIKIEQAYPYGGCTREMCGGRGGGRRGNFIHNDTQHSQKDTQHHIQPE
jgi:hypothetical protein